MTAIYHYCSSLSNHNNLRFYCPFAQELLFNGYSVNVQLIPKAVERQIQDPLNQGDKTKVLKVGLIDNVIMHSYNIVTDNLWNIMTVRMERLS